MRRKPLRADRPVRRFAAAARPGYFTREMASFEMISRWIWLVPS